MSTTYTLAHSMRCLEAEFVEVPRRHRDFALVETAKQRPFDAASGCRAA